MEIFNPAKLEDLRENCKTINGDVTFSKDWEGDINLDGVEIITGWLWYFGCCEEHTSSCDVHKDAFNFSSSTLREVRGTVEIECANGLEHLKLPRLQNTTSFTMEKNKNVTEVDITDLTEARLGVSLANMPSLRRIKNNGFTHSTYEVYQRAIECSETPKLESVGGLFSGSAPADEVLSMTVHTQSNSDGIGNGTQKLEDFIVGWPNISNFEIQPMANIQLGNNETESMHIDHAIIDMGTSFSLGSKLEKLTIGSFEPAVLNDASEARTYDTIDVPSADHLEELEIRIEPRMNVSVKYFSLPEKAKKWDGLYLSLTMNQTEFRAKDEENKTIWHWPRNLTSVSLEGKFDKSLM